DSMYQTSSEISDWSMQGVMFEARDIYDSVAYSYQVNFIVKGVEFTAQRADTGTVTFGDSAEFQGTGLPNSQVKARLLKGDTLLNTTVVSADGTWSMEISSSQLGDDGDYQIYFAQDGQFIGKDDSNEITLQSGEAPSEGFDTWVWIVIAVVAFAILLGVGAFFFLEFEEEFEDDPEAAMEQQKQEDPYAWAKARAAEQAAGELTPAPAPVPAAQPQHPGWIWDAQSNQWVADPNYRPPQQ
ncbi:MAG: hypothetical protein ACPHDM_01915, partial [Candidatus Poseidoniaceae archaeon]